MGQEHEVIDPLSYHIYDKVGWGGYVMFVCTYNAVGNQVKQAWRKSPRRKGFCEFKEQLSKYREGRTGYGTNVERRATPSDGGQQGFKRFHPVRENDKRL